MTLEEAMDADWNFLAWAVRLNGGIEETARFLGMTQHDLKKCLRKGMIEVDLARKLGRKVEMYWPFIAYGAR